MFHFRLHSFSRLMISLTLAAGLICAGRRREGRRTDGRTRPANSISMCCRCPGRPPSAKRRPSAAARSQIQCGGRPYAFVVHGLWPQYENGFPEYCQRPSPRLNRNIVSSMLDLMPAPGLIFNEWDKHGTCSGLDRPQLFRDDPQSARRDQDSGRISRPVAGQDRRAGRGRGGLHQGQSGPEQRRRLGHLQPDAALRGPHLPQQGFAIPRLRGNRPPRLPPRPADDAADQGWVAQQRLVPLCSGRHVA